MSDSPDAVVKAALAWNEIAEAVTEWRTVTDIACSSYGRRVGLFKRAVDLFADAVRRGGSLRFRGSVAQARLIAVLRWATKLQLRSPRARLLQSDLSTSFWQQLRGGERRPGAFFRFLGVPTDLFDELAAAFARPREQGAPQGRIARFDDVDSLALALRYLQTVGNQESLQIEFGAAHTAVSRALWPALERLREVILTFDDAHCKYPTEEEAFEMERAVRAQYGEPPTGADFARPCVLLLDGTVTPVHGVSSLEHQRLYAHRSGVHALNHVLMSDVYGRIVAYAICAPGTSHDARLAAPLIEQQKSTVTNPHCLGLLVDSGFVGVTHDGNDGAPACFRPLATEMITASIADIIRAFSRYMTVRRQAVEWANNMLKKSFPRICVPMQLSQLERYRTVFECAIHLSNFRTRRIGFNQLNTTFRRHVDENFREQLVASQRLGGTAGLELYFRQCGSSGEVMLAK